MRVKPGDRFTMILTKDNAHVKQMTDVRFAEVLSHVVQFAILASDNGALITDVDAPESRTYHFIDTQNITHTLVIARTVTV